jgi:transposase
VIVQGTSVGLDVHALSVVAHAVDEETGKVARARLCPDHGEVLGWLYQLRAPVRVAYEAGPTGLGLARAITEAGMECVVAAPSKLQRPAGDRVKTDARDAAHLARLLRLGEITAVRVPEREIEAVRDLVRAREDARADLMRVRHRLSNCCCGKGLCIPVGHHGHARTRSGCADTVLTTFTSRRPSITASTRCWRRPRRGTALTSRSWWWPPRRGSPTRSTGWVVCVASRL